MKYLIILLLVLTSVDLYAYVCSNKKRSKSAIIFVDTNHAELEINAVEKSACQRGEELIIIPKPDVKVKEYALKITKAEKAFDKLCGAKSINLDKCDENWKLVSTLKKELTDYQLKKEPFSKEMLKSELSKLKNKDIDVSSLIMSGHDGGGLFNGLNGAFSKKDIDEAFVESGTSKDALKSLYLLGCYTGVFGELANWKERFPGLKLIGGYEGVAPLADKKAGHTYIEDLLLKERSIISSKKGDELKSKLESGIQDLQSLNASIYAQIGCDGSEYIYRPQKPQKFKPFSSAECKAAREMAGPLRDDLALYMSGDKAIPKEKHGVRLREIYTFSRQNAHCFESEDREENVMTLQKDPLSDPEKIFYLLFSDGIMENFIEFYRDDHQRFVDQKDIIQFDQLAATLESEIRTTKENYEQNLRSVSAMKSDPANYKKIIQEEIEAAKLKLQELEKNPLLPKNEIGNSPYQDQLIQEYYALTSSISYHQSELTASFEEVLKERERNIKVIGPYISQREGDLASFHQSVKDFKENFVMPTKENLGKLDRKTLMKNASILTGLTQFNNQALRFPEFEKIRHYRYKVENMLLHYKCIPFEWHEKGNETTKPKMEGACSTWADESFGYKLNIGKAKLNGMGMGMDMGLSFPRSDAE